VRTVTPPNLTTLEGTALTSTNMYGKSLRRYTNTAVRPLVGVYGGRPAGLMGKGRSNRTVARRVGVYGRGRGHERTWGPRPGSS
jgi:hypothetical protein